VPNAKKIFARQHGPQFRVEVEGDTIYAVDQVTEELLIEYFEK